MKAIWSFFQRWFRSENSSQFTWHEPGPDNPFAMRILDIRPLTQTMVSTTSNPEIAQSFVELRKSDGSDLASQRIDPVTVKKCNLVLPHNGEALEGIVSKADSMEVKWDIYAYDSHFLFARSWTGNLIYRASFEVSDNALTVNRVESVPAHEDKAIESVYFLLVSHAMGRVIPNPINDSTIDDPEQIALASFNEFGNRACFATFDDVTKVPVSLPETETE